MINKRRLLNVARAIDESPDPSEFHMGSYGIDNACNTPCCALGHYAARTDLQSSFLLSQGQILTNDSARTEIGYDDPAIREHFGITPSEADELFAAEGCGEAQTASDASEYIRSFVAEHE